MSDHTFSKQHRLTSISIACEAIALILLIGGARSVLGQAQCPASGSTSSFTFTPQLLGDSTTVTIDLAPCETIALTESHDMGGDGNRGTNVKITYQNSAGQPIHDETIFGFFTGTNNFPASVPWPYPWRGARASNVLPYSIKVESVNAYGQGNPPSPPSYSFSYTKTPRPGYNVGGDSFSNAPLVPALPTTYPGSVYQNWSSSSNPQADPGQYFKVHLKCKQAIYVYGSATGSSQDGANYRIDLYDAAQGLIQANWVYLAAYGTVTYNSSAFTNPNSTDADFYIRVSSDNWPVYDFTLNIDEYVASNNVSNPRPVAPDATGSGGSVSSEEYHLPAAIDADVLTNRMTELWAKMYWPTDFSGGPYPLVVFLHGNHGTCGITGTSPRVDDENVYTYFGTCGESRFLVSGNAVTARNNSAGWFGMKITTGPDPLVVKSLGRIFITGNAGTHTIKIVRAVDNALIGSASLSLSTGVNNKIRYQDLSSPVTLTANTAYYIVSQEFVGGDQWYDSDATITGTGVATVNGSASSSDGSSWTVGSTPGHSYGWVDFVYDYATGRSVVQNHLGYEYLATQLASRGYIVASVNANRGITSANDGEHVDDPPYIFARGRLVLKHLQTLKTWNSGPTGLITVGTLGTSRKNATGWFGMQITVGPQPITVYSLGRMFLTGNNQTHTVKIVRASDGTDVPNGSVAIPMTGGTNGTFKYVNLTTPVRLAANTSYYIASQETKNKDSWYDSNTTVSSTSLATVNGRVTSSNGTTWDTSGAVPGNVYVPIDLKYQVLSVNLTGKIDFNNVGLMGHSRGGQGVRAAYNLYRNSSIDPRGPISPTWSQRIPGMNIKGIFEIGPTDSSLPTTSDGFGSQYLNADGTTWNVLLPMCDGDVTSLEGVRVFDRSLRFTNENPATQKSTYTVWGANHDFYNTEWQDSDPNIPGITKPSSACIGTGNTTLFTYPTPAGNSSGSLQQQQTALASLLALFRGNLGSSPTPSFNQNFDPRYDEPTVVTSVTRVDRGYTASPHTSVTTVIQDFDQQVLGNDYCGTPGVCGSAVTAITAEVPHHVYRDVTSQMAALVSWSSAGCDQYFQVNAASPINLSGYQTLDFRTSRRNDSVVNSSTATSLSISLVTATGVSNPLPLKKYTNLTGPVGGYAPVQDPVSGLWTWAEDYRPILQSVRIPLTDFTGVNLDLTRVQAVRFVFSDTPTGSVFLANIRASH